MGVDPRFLAGARVAGWGVDRMIDEAWEDEVASEGFWLLTLVACLAAAVGLLALGRAAWAWWR